MEICARQEADERIPVYKTKTCVELYSRFYVQEALKKVGFTILRFDDDAVLNHIDNVFNQIIDFIEGFEKIKKTTPFNSPASGGQHEA